MRFICSFVLFSLVALGPTTAVAQFSTVRLAVVPSPEETGLLRELLPAFERESGYRVEVFPTEDPHGLARAGQADLVISHYGHMGTEAFIAQGFGLWPRAVFANQIAIFGPTSDPARIGGLQDSAEAFRRIAEKGSRSQLVSNNSGIMKYLESILWEQAGRPAKESWYVDQGLSEADGMTLAATLKAYYVFALPPFLTWQQTCSNAEASGATARSSARPSVFPHHSAPCDMEPLVLVAMPARIMVSMVVNPQRIAAVNVTGATALQAYLLRPAVQARVDSFRDVRSPLQLWKSAGLHNSPAGLGLGGRP